MFASNLRFAVRTLLGSPATTLAAVVALALGIGSTAAMFSIVNSVLLRPLSYSQPDRLVVAFAANPSRNIPQFRVSIPNYLDYQNLNRSLRLGTWSMGAMVLTGGDRADNLVSATISPGLFDILGVAPRLGNNFSADNEVPGKNRVVLLSHAIWRSRFGADGSIVGKSIQLDGQAHLVSGVMPPSFRLLDQTAEIFVPQAIVPSAMTEEDRGRSVLDLVGRLNEGVSLEQAQTDLDSISARLGEAHTDLNKGWLLRIVPLTEKLLGNSRSGLLALFGAVVFVLLIACANVANLLLARAGARLKEIAVRAALGASAGALIGQLLLESVLLSLTGGALGLGLAWLAIRALVRYGTAALPRLSEISIDPLVVLFTLAVALATGVLFGLAPAVTFARIDLNSVLRASGRGTSGDAVRAFLRNALVVSEVALTMVLLTGCGLLLRSLWTLQQVDRGYQVTQTLTFKVALPESRYKDMAVARFYGKLLEEIEGTPGVELAGMARDVPLSGANPTLNYVIEGAPPLASGDQPRARFRLASADYFKTLRIPLLRGRYFELADIETSPAVVIINEALAKQMFPGKDPLGLRLRCGIPGSAFASIVGIVNNTRSIGLDTDPGPETYYPYRQVVPALMSFVEGTASIAVRAKGEPEALTGAMRGVLRRLDPELALFQAKTMEELLNDSVAQPKFRTLLLVAFAAVALVLAVIGLYGVLAYSVTQRTQELGVRMALGASSADILKLVIGQGMRLALLGVAIGMVAALVLAGAIEKLLFGVKPWDAAAFVATPALLLAVALVATYLPARKALKIDPLISIRSE